MLRNETLWDVSWKDINISVKSAPLSFVFPIQTNLYEQKKVRAFPCYLLLLFLLVICNRLVLLCTMYSFNPPSPLPTQKQTNRARRERVRCFCKCNRIKRIRLKFCWSVKDISMKMLPAEHVVFGEQSCKRKTKRNLNVRLTPLDYTHTHTFTLTSLTHNENTHKL